MKNALSPSHVVGSVTTTDLDSGQHGAARNGGFLIDRHSLVILLVEERDDPSGLEIIGTASRNREFASSLSVAKKMTNIATFAGADYVGFGSNNERAQYSMKLTRTSVKKNVRGLLVTQRKGIIRHIQRSYEDSGSSIYLIVSE